MDLIKKTLSWNGIRSSHRLMVLIVVVLGLLNFFWGEKVPAGNGFGWDGVFYAEMVRNLDSMIADGTLSGYYAQRILPSAIVRSMLLLAGMPSSDANIIHGFELYNLVLLVGACWAWKRVADNFSLSLGGRWMGFSAIFVNYQCSKQAFYYPVLTDVTALFVAMLLMLFYVERRPVALFVTAIVGAFCWPVVSVCGALLLVFLGSSLPTAVVAPAPPSLTIKSFTVSQLAGLGAVLALSMIGYMSLTLTEWGPACNTPAMFANAMAARPCELDRLFARQFLTALPSLAAMLIALVMLVGSGSFFQAVLANLRSARWPLWALAMAAVAIPFGVVKLISNPGVAAPSSLMRLVDAALFPPEGKFLLPAVTLAVFWGPVVLLLLLYWKQFCVEVRKLGPGVVAVIAISLPLGMVGEPRFMTVAWPFFVLGLVLALEAASTKASFKWALAVLTVAYAQFWMRFNLSPWLAPDGAGLLLFPKQVYFMHYGLWMAWWPYLLQLAALVLSAIWLHKTVINVGVANNQCRNSTPAANECPVATNP
jgi:hypothetical protein